MTVRKKKGRVDQSVLATGWTVRRSNPGGGEIFRTCPDRPRGPPSLLYNGYLIFPGIKSGRGVTLTPHPIPVPWSRKSRAIPLLPLWAVRPVQSLSACTTVTFTIMTVRITGDDLINLLRPTGYFTYHQV
jgi:hypothetical protein